MYDSIIKNGTLLGLSQDLDSLLVLEKVILGAFPECRFDMATTFQVAIQYLSSYTYDLIILDMTNDWGSELLTRVVIHNFPTVVLMDNRTPPEDVRHYMASKLLTFLPREKLKEIVPMIERILKREGVFRWKYGVNKLADLLTRVTSKLLSGCNKNPTGLNFPGY